MRRALLLLLPLVMTGCSWFTPRSHPIPVVGGKELHLMLPDTGRTFVQTDPKWATVPLGNTTDCYLGGHGCTICSVAMACTNLGAPLTPVQLNERLKNNDGFKPVGWIIWNALPRVTQGAITADYHTQPSHAIIDTALEHGAYPIIQHPLPKGGLHWVIVIGKDGHDYLVRDPLRKTAKPIRLSKLASTIHAVRVVKKAS